MIDRAEALRTELVAAWRRSDAVFDLLAPEAFEIRPINLRHSFCFYVGHLAAFAHNQVAVGLLGRPPSHEAFAELFEFGIDPRDDVPGAQTWPDMPSIEAYRDTVRERMLGLFDEVAAMGSDDELVRGGRIFDVVIEHEQMHHETLMYMVAQLEPSARKIPNGYRLPAHTAPPSDDAVTVGPGRFIVGCNRDEVPFSWDNEGPSFESSTQPFAIDRFAVSNHAFARFVDAGGYNDRRLWDEDGWRWREELELQRPIAWIAAADGSLAVASTFENVPWSTAASWPVQVSHAEAEAYCRWRGGALPSELQLRRCMAAENGLPMDLPAVDPQAEAWRSLWTARPVNAAEAADNPVGLAQLRSNGWEWTSTPFLPYPGFEPWIRTYPGYSANFFDGRHRVMVGGSWATDRRLQRPSFRNWFQRLYPYVFSKFRCAYAA